MKENKKILIIILSAFLVLAVILAIIFIILFLLKPKYEVKLNPNGGTITKEIKIDNGVIKELPEITPPENKELVCWVNEKNEAIRKNIKLTDDTTLTPIWRPAEGENVTIKFVSGTYENIPDIKIPKGSGLYLPVNPNNYKNWKFLYWVDKDEYVALIGTKVEKDMTLYAYWWKPGSGGTSKETATIKFDTGTSETFDEINLIKGSKYIFVTPTQPNGDKVFRGWLDDNGNLLNSDSIVERDMTLKANWKEPYTCPEGCVPNDSGMTCNKENIVTPSSKEICPSGSFLYYGKCITKSGGESAQIRQCSMFGDEVMYEDWCMKVVQKVIEYTCPEGYNRDGNNCKKIETINCTVN